MATGREDGRFLGRVLVNAGPGPVGASKVCSACLSAKRVWRNGYGSARTASCNCQGMRLKVLAVLLPAACVSLRRATVRRDSRAFRDLCGFVRSRETTADGTG